MFYPAILKDVIRGSSDAIDALDLFRDLLLGRNDAPDSIGFMAFDAHVGDTSCQLRAGMLREVVMAHRGFLQGCQSDKDPTPSWLVEAQDRLVKVRKAAKEACSKLTHGRFNPSELGFGAKHDSPDGILKALEWLELSLAASPASLYNDFVALQSTTRANEHRSSSASSRELLQTTSNLPRPKGVLYRTICSALNFAKRVLLLIRRSRRVVALNWRIQGTSRQEQYVLSHEDAPCCEPKPSTRFSGNEAVSKEASEALLLHLTSLGDIPSTGQENDLITTEWKLLDVKVITRFLVYSYILSKYKVFCRLQNVVGARLDPNTAADYGIELVRDCIDYSVRDYKHANAGRKVALEFQALQIWLADLSCAWLQSMATRSLSKANIGRLLAQTTQRSVKHITSMPCYVGYLLLREMWSRDQDTVIMVDRRFCKHGFHSNFFLARLEFKDMAAADDTEVASPFTLGHKVTWHVSHVSADQLLHDPDQDTPHIIAMGNSIAGSYVDYMAASSPHSTTSSVHDDDACANNVEHIATFLAADHDRLALGLFASHKHYAFPLAHPDEEREGEEAIVARQMRETDEKIATHWERSKYEAEALGTADSLRVFAWQHVLLETKARIAKGVLDRNDTMPLSAAVGSALEAKDRS